VSTFLSFSFTLTFALVNSRQGSIFTLHCVSTVTGFNIPIAICKQNRTCSQCFLVFVLSAKLDQLGLIHHRYTSFSFFNHGFTAEYSVTSCKFIPQNKTTHLWRFLAVPGSESPHFFPQQGFF